MSEQEFTNRANLPHEIVQALTKQRYEADDGSGKKTDYSITSLIAPPRLVILNKRHPNIHKADVLDNLWSMLGHMMHNLLEEHGHDEAITEKRFYKEVLGRTISGQVDHYKDGKITDYKFTKTYKVERQSFEDWEAQLNLYSILCEDHGHKVDALRIIAVLRDRQSFGGGPNYPKEDIVVLPFIKWSRPARERFLEQKVAQLIAAENLPDDQLPRCSDKERWMEWKEYAVYQAKGDAKAKKLFHIRPNTAGVPSPYQDREECRIAAEEFCKSIGGYIEDRWSPPRRCEGYCPVASVCNQYQEYLGKASPKKEFVKPVVDEAIAWDF